MQGKWHGGKGDKARKVDQDKFSSNWDAIFGKKEDKNFKRTQQDLTELNSDGNRQRGHYGEDESNLNEDEDTDLKFMTAEDYVSGTDEDE